MILHIRQLCWSFIKKALKQYFLYEVVFRIKQFETRLGCVVDMHIIDISGAASSVVQVLQKSSMEIWLEHHSVDICYQQRLIFANPKLCNVI